MNYTKLHAVLLVSLVLMATFNASLGRLETRNPATTTSSTPVLDSNLTPKNITGSPPPLVLPTTTPMPSMPALDPNSTPKEITGSPPPLLPPVTTLPPASKDTHNVSVGEGPPGPSGARSSNAFSLKYSTTTASVYLFFGALAFGVCM
ncbi:hypothetical protein CROQUDRAFT_681498 [Cronartium quercuum f. sp. fusiforme G11]|uniref:Uncharacterized protein n=1 Tax=Cronartium quercuum f. sp. fusiforme G11 TaxID=708437 RepID=A0A9P6N9Q2_9BASI|nr:hypothetical protein CROQUDRAFT_681498 [Cronartium quercuum f. sp. fusiforme G11]